MQRTRLRLSTALSSGAVLASLVLAGCGDDKDSSNPETGVGSLQPNAGSALDKAYAGLGGKAALQELNGIKYEASGQRFALNEGFNPGDVTFINSYTTERTLALSGEQLRLETERQLDFIGITADNTYTEIVDGNAGYLQGDEALAPGFAPADTAMTAARVASIKKQQMLLNPQIVLAKVAKGELTATPAPADLIDGQLQQSFQVGGVRFYVSSASGHITKLSTLEDVSPYKDASVEVFFDEWQPGIDTDVMFPGIALMSAAGEVVLTETRKATEVVAQFGSADFLLPTQSPFSAAEAKRGAESQAALSQPQALGIPFRDSLQTTVDAVELAPGVWHLTGGSHHSLAVEQANGYVLVEAPLDPYRTLAITNWASAQFPGKPLSYVISTHHHEDHSAGVRQAVGVGARLVANQNGAVHWQRVLNAPATIIQDALAGVPPRTTVDLVPTGSSLVLPDAARPVTAYAIANCHASDMLVIGVGDILFASDIVSPGNGQPICPLSQTLGAVQAQGFNPRTIAGGHGGTALAAELLAQFPD
jgi:glyoxylase-like metal-dependent hydrolase (beta-lactamase superfamily II)